MQLRRHLKAAAVLLAVCIIVCLTFAACSHKNNSDNASESQNASEINNGESSENSGETDAADAGPEENEPVYTIKTEYCDLKFPEKWQGYVNAVPVEGEPYTVKFSYMDGTPLFDIVFGEEAGTLLGTIDSKKGVTPVYYVGYELDTGNVGYYDQLGIQDSADVILQNLKKDYGLKDESVESESEEVFAIDTNFATLYYPKKWEDKVTVDVNGKIVTFSYDDTDLFDIRFEKCDGAYLGSYYGTPVYAVSYDISPDKYTDEEYRDICAMQDDVNVIVEHLGTGE